MRERMIERNEVRMDALEQSGAVRLGDAHQPDAIAERRGLGDIGGDHLTNTGDRDLIEGRTRAEREAGEERELVRGVDAVDIEARIHLGIAQRLRLGDDVAEIAAFPFHLAKSDGRHIRKESANTGTTLGPPYHKKT